MSVTFQNVNGTATNANADGSAKASSSSVNQNDFLQLLVTQLKNQDPLNPTDQTQMLAQLAQFSSLQQMQSLNTTMTGAASLNQLAQTAALIGKTVTTADQSVSGVVQSVIMQNNKPYLQVGNQLIDPSTIGMIN